MGALGPFFAAALCLPGELVPRAAETRGERVCSKGKGKLFQIKHPPQDI